MPPLSARFPGLHPAILPAAPTPHPPKRADRKDVGEAGRPHGTEEGVDVGESVLYLFYLHLVLLAHRLVKLSDHKVEIIITVVFSENFINEPARPVLKCINMVSA